MTAENSSSARVLALLSQKGGSGKTTLAAHLAVAFGRDRRVVLVDTDPQRSASAWWRARDRAVPELAETAAGEIIATVRRIRASGGGLIVVDTMPSVAADIASIARVSDFVLIPCRPSVLDLRAIGGTVEVVRSVRTAAAIVINAAPAPRGAGEASLTHEARGALRQYGLPVLPHVIGQRAVLAHALAAGLAVEEFEPDSKAAAEIRALAGYVEEALWHDAPILQPST